MRDRDRTHARKAQCLTLAELRAHSLSATLKALDAVRRVVGGLAGFAAAAITGDAHHRLQITARHFALRLQTVRQWQIRRRSQPPTPRTTEPEVMDQQLACNHSIVLRSCSSTWPAKAIGALDNTTQVCGHGGYSMPQSLYYKRHHRNEGRRSHHVRRRACDA